MRGSSISHGQYAESMASGTTAVNPAASIGRSVGGTQPRERASSGKYSLGETSRQQAESREGKEKDNGKDRETIVNQKGAVVRRPEDLVKVVKDRMFSWSYMMTWYQGCVILFRAECQADRQATLTGSTRSRFPDQRPRPFLAQSSSSSEHGTTMYSA